MSVESNANIVLAKAQADALGLKGDERHEFLKDYIAPKPSNWHKRARAEAYRIAKAKGYWAQCRALLPWWQRLFGAIFPWSRRKLLERVARLYRFNLDRLVAEIHGHRPGTRAYDEWRELERAKKKLAKARMKKQLAEAAKRHDPISDLRSRAGA